MNSYTKRSIEAELKFLEENLTFTKDTYESFKRIKELLEFYEADWQDRSELGGL